MSQTLNTRAAQTGVRAAFSACDALGGWDAARVPDVIRFGPGSLSAIPRRRCSELSTGEAGLSRLSTSACEFDSLRLRRLATTGSSSWKTAANSSFRWPIEWTR